MSQAYFSDNSDILKPQEACPISPVLSYKIDHYIPKKREAPSLGFITIVKHRNIYSWKII